MEIDSNSVLDTIGSSLNLTSINDDCKMEIFKHLEFQDMINISETSKQLHAAVQDVFKRKYGSGKVIIRGDRGFYRENGYEPDIIIWNKLLILKLLRNFGHLISHIYPVYNKPPVFESTHPPAFIIRINIYLAVYCSKTLKKLLLHDDCKFLFDIVRVPFQNVESINLYNSAINFKKLHFKINFPNLQSLKLSIHKDVTESLNIADKLPSVLHVFIESFSQDMEVLNRDVIEFLRLNPQLEKLNLRFSGEFSIGMMQCIRDYLPKLESFSLYCESISRYVEIGTFHLENVVDFKLKRLGCNYIPFTFDKLKRFQFSCYDVDIKPCMLDFIIRNEHLKILYIYSCKDPLSDLIESEFVLSNIEYITIDNYVNQMSPDSVFRFLDASRSLKKLKVHSYCRFGAEWINDTVKSKASKYKLKGELTPRTKTLIFTR